MEEEAQEEWTPVTEDELWGGLLISVFGGLGLGSYRFHELIDHNEQLEKIIDRRQRKRLPKSPRRGGSLRGEIWRFKHINAPPPHHDG